MKLLIFIILYLISFSSYACSCGFDKKVEDLVSSSELVFLGEIKGILRTGKLVESGEMQEWKLFIYPVEIYNGKPKKEYQFISHSYFNRPGGVVVDSNKGAEIVLLATGDCGQLPEIGQRVVILLEKHSNRAWSYCSENLLHEDTARYKYFYNEIRQKL